MLRIVSTALDGIPSPIGEGPNRATLTVFGSPGRPWSTIGIWNVALACPARKLIMPFTGVKSTFFSAVIGSAM